MNSTHTERSNGIPTNTCHKNCQNETMRDLLRYILKLTNNELLSFYF